MTENEDGICDKCKKMLVQGIKKRKKASVKKKSNRAYPKALARAKASFQRLRRLEESDENGMCKCVNGEIRHWTKCDGGHYFPATYLNTCFNRMNVHPQSKIANRNMNDPVIQDEYKTFLIYRYGIEAVKQLEQLTKIPKKYSAIELEMMADEFNIEVLQILEKRNEKGIQTNNG
jgi:hypothetical protein